MMSMNLTDIAVLNTKGADYGSIISGISKSEAIKLLQNIDLTEKSGTLFERIYKNGKNDYKI